MLPMEIAAAQSKMLFGPDDLCADSKADGFEACSDFGGMHARVPDVGDIAMRRAAMLCSNPLGSSLAIVPDLPLMAQPGTLAPGRI